MQLTDDAIDTIVLKLSDFFDPNGEMPDDEWDTWKDLVYYYLAPYSNGYKNHN